MSSSQHTSFGLGNSLMSQGRIIHSGRNYPAALGRKLPPKVGRYFKLRPPSGIPRDWEIYSAYHSDV